jgi:hypothetical protein
MSQTSHISLNAFKEVSISDKAKAITMFGTLLASTKAFGVNFFLYSIDNYFVEATSVPETGDVLYIRATDLSAVMDLYLNDIRLPEL